MFASPRTHADSYHRVHVETGAQAGDPHKLIGAVDGRGRSLSAMNMGIARRLD
jgi:hypothetical protein